MINEILTNTKIYKIVRWLYWQRTTQIQIRKVLCGYGVYFTPSPREINQSAYLFFVDLKKVFDIVQLLYSRDISVNIIQTIKDAY